MLRVLCDKVVVKPEKSPEKSEGGIVLPGNAQPEGAIRGVVVSVGRGVTLPNGALRELEVKAGETILYSPMAGVKIKDGEDEVVIITEQQIIAIVGQ